MWTELTRALARARFLHWMLWAVVVVAIPFFAPGPAATIWSIALWCAVCVVAAVAVSTPWTPELNRLFNWACGTLIALMCCYTAHTLGTLL